MFQGTRFHIFIFLLTTILCLGGLGLIFISQDSVIKKSGAHVDESRAVVAQTQETLLLLYSTLSLQRGYLLSGDVSLLEEYDLTKGILTENIARLQEMATGYPTQESRVAELQHHYLAFVQIMDDMISRYKADNYTGGQTDLNKITELRRSFHRVATAILTEEVKDLQAHSQQRARANQLLYLQLGIGFLLVSLILTAINYLLLRSYSHRASIEETLEHTEERLRLAIRGTNDGIYDWNLQQDTLYWSPQFKEMLGYEDHDLDASRETLDHLLHPSDRDQVWDMLEKYFNREVSELSLIFRLQHKTGRWLWIRMRGKALFDEDGKVMRLIGGFSDISSLKEYEVRLEEAKTQAEKANEAKTEFLAHMSHEIRTPLTSISGVAEILVGQKKGMSDKQQQLVNVLSYSTKSLKELINDILDFSKIESGQLELENKPFVLEELFQEITSIMAVRAQEKGIKFSFTAEKLSGPRIVGDKMRIRQVLMNLIGNALKFTQQGSVDVNVSATEVNGVQVLQIDVRDTGIGIDAKNFDLVFERFRQADPSVSRKYGGTGLGLPISKSLVENMGGAITLQSEVGQGSLISVILPLNFAADSDKAEVDMPRKDAKHQLRVGANDKRRILLVEDYEGNIAFLSYLLESMNYDYDVARTGLEALNLWKEGKHDLILMDVQMPEMDGITATRQIRQMESEQSLPHTPIIGMTAHAFVEDQDKCVEAGMDSYLAKPLSESDLLSEIYKYLKEKEAGPSRHAS